LSGDVIAIDGPAGSGKSTVAKALSRRLGYTYIDTGAMYRGMTWLAMHKGIDLHDEKALTLAAREAEFSFRYEEGEDPPFRVMVNGMDLTREVRGREVTARVSQVSANPSLRKELVKKQRELASGKNVVMEGRDIGTMVFPQARHKFFITATVEERARRRCLDLADEGYEVREEMVGRELMKRDLLDSSRSASPFKQAPDAVVIDTTGMSVEDVVNHIMRVLQAGKPDGG
jgi:cytidylate kinase